MTTRADAAPRGARAMNVERTRARITIEGIRLFEEQGFSKTTVDQIIRAAGVSQRTFFRYFPTKEAVLFGEIDAKTVLARLEAPGQEESVGESLLALASVWEIEVNGQEGRRRAVRYALQQQHPSIGSCLDDQLRRLEPQIIEAVARRLDVDPSHDLRPTVAAQMFGALARLVMRRPPGDNRALLAEWFRAASQLVNSH